MKKAKLCCWVGREISSLRPPECFFSTLPPTTEKSQKFTVQILRSPKFGQRGDDERKRWETMLKRQLSCCANNENMQKIFEGRVRKLGNQTQTSIKFVHWNTKQNKARKLPSCDKNTLYHWLLSTSLKGNVNNMCFKMEQIGVYEERETKTCNIYDV